MYFIPDLFLVGVWRLMLFLAVLINSLLSWSGPVSFMGSVPRFAVLIIPSCLLRLRSKLNNFCFFSCFGSTFFFYSISITKSPIFSIFIPVFEKLILIIYIYFILAYSFVSVLFVGLLLSLRFVVPFSFTSFDTFSSYECGFDPMCSSHVCFCIKFFLLAILFLVFDVEVGFLVPGLWSSSLIFSFVLILILGLVFEFTFGGLDWVY